MRRQSPYEVESMSLSTFCYQSASFASLVLFSSHVHSVSCIFWFCVASRTIRDLCRKQFNDALCTQNISLHWRHYFLIIFSWIRLTSLCVSGKRYQLWLLLILCSSIVSFFFRSNRKELKLKIDESSVFAIAISKVLCHSLPVPAFVSFKRSFWWPENRFFSQFNFQSQRSGS